MSVLIKVACDMPLCLSVLSVKGQTPEEAREAALGSGFFVEVRQPEGSGQDRCLADHT